MLTGKDVLPKKDLLRKDAAIERFEYFPLGQELKKRTSIAEKQYQKFDTAFEFNKKEEVEKSQSKSKLVFNDYFTFHKNHNTNEFVRCSLDSKLNDLRIN